MSETEGTLRSAKSRVRDVIIEYLRESILCGNLVPGDTLHESELTKRFGTSRSPVREALLYLEQEGLLHTVPKMGTFVTGIDPIQLKQALFIRSALEIANIELLCQTITPEQVERLRENVRLQKFLLREGDYSLIYNSFDEFHLLLCEFNGLPRVWEIVRKEKISLDRLHAIEKKHMPRMQVLYEQHGAIVEALAERDRNLCVELIQSHADLDFEAKSVLAGSMEGELPIQEKWKMGTTNEDN